MNFAGVEVSEQLLAAGLVALWIAGQSLRDALWSHGSVWFTRKPEGELSLEPAKA